MRTVCWRGAKSTGCTVAGHRGFGCLGRVKNLQTFSSSARWKQQNGPRKTIVKVDLHIVIGRPCEDGKSVTGRGSSCHPMKVKGVHLHPWDLLPASRQSSPWWWVRNPHQATAQCPPCVAWCLLCQSLLQSRLRLSKPHPSLFSPLVPVLLVQSPWSCG